MCSCTFCISLGCDLRSVVSDTFDVVSWFALSLIRVVFSQYTIMDYPTTWMSLMFLIRSPFSPKWLTLCELKIMV